MSNSANEDREQRKASIMGESDAMTIEFLRARLLAERSVSKTARQRADELAKRVAELTEQLKFVSLQRKKAERATADVLAILENNGISDVSEEFDSASDQEETPHEFRARSGMINETSTNLKLRENESEAYSSSEIESSPSTGRSLSWKSTKDPQRSLEKKKYLDSFRRRASFLSSSSSARRAGKSCRRIRHRESRSMKELQNVGTQNAMCSKYVPSCSDGERVAFEESSGYDNRKTPQESLMLRSNGEKQETNGHYFNVHERDKDMESALQHQAQLIGQYEEEERAQREWEEKFRENNSGTQDSGDPGNHSDVTEELYEMKPPELPCATQTLSSNSQEAKQEAADARFSEEPQISKSLPSPTDDNKRSLQEEKRSSIIASESSAADFSFPISEEKSDQDLPLKQDESSSHRCQKCLTHPSAQISPTHEGKNIPLFASRVSSSPLELAVVPRETSSNLGSVLEALQQAKLSLTQKLNSNVAKPSNPETNKVDTFQFPISSPGLFRLPTDNQFEATTRANPSTDARPSFTNFPHEIAPSTFLTEPFAASRSVLSAELFDSLNNRPPLTPEISRGILPPQRSISQPRLSEGQNMDRLDPYMNHVLPSVKDYYPFLPDVSLRIPLNEEGASRTFSGSERGLPPVMRLSSSSNDEHVRPNMYR